MTVSSVVVCGTTVSYPAFIPYVITVPHKETQQTLKILEKCIPNYYD